MNRFSKRRESPFILRELAMPVAFFAAVMVLFFAGMRSVDSAAQQEQLESTRRAISRAAVHCYAVEGFYPPDLSYLEERYGLRVNHEKYMVDYRPFAANMMPDITVLARSDLQKDE